ncbi:RagB/SusD family nutrient uptake outer membrane protein [Chitinophaga oryziterrae]|uniref:RagB/SusD family nutrient uptake outer membrane protein n=1 Tax=Chitinophaga oryziterrae TaxID=1031224 RepID=A0A6N8J8W5_9BACT|nr:RagB/SusD family nutrient uptake outer membrane protein [Chitinophaga oryziterrae]MVT40552.1 RagB/SusD family nutrient uptake outer membrane protein [Chitinophaga oryziterrae]
MKTNRFYTYTAALIIGLSACNKQLNTAPSDAVSEDILFKNVANLSTISEGTWASMMDDFYGGTYSNPGFKTIALTSDAMADDVALITTKYGFPTAYRFTQMNDKTQSRVTAIWGQLYKIINNSNIVIANVDKVEGDSTAKKVLKGQVLALRAHTYLTIASFYQFSYLKDSLAKTAPIYTVPTTAATVGNPKASLKEIYELIFSDLLQAKVLLTNYDRPAKYKINADVVNGLLARAYLNTGRWAQAAAAADEAQRDYPLMIPSEYSKGFNDVNNSEWIWGHPEIPSQSDGSYSFNFLDVSSSSSYYYSFMADPLFGELFEGEDIRKTLFSWDGSAAAREGYLQYKKFKFKADQTADLVLMRSSEAILIKAEGYARAGNLTEGINALNQLRTARGAKTFEPTGATQDDLIKEILIERRKELWGEGFGLSDIIRNQLPVVRKPYVDANGNDIKVTVVTPDGTTKQVAAKYHTALKFSDGTNFGANSPYYIFVIPQGEEQNNPNLYK